MDLSQIPEEDIHEAFGLFDTDKTGFMDLFELKCAFRALGFDISAAEVSSVFRSLGKGHDDGISFDDFLAAVKDFGHKEDPQKYARRMFKAFDASQKGQIRLLDLKKICSDVGENVSLKELEDMMKSVDAEGKGYIDENDFFAMLFPHLS